MTTHSYQLAGTKLFAAATLLSIISRKPLEETLQMVSYDADNPEASVDVAVPVLRFALHGPVRIEISPSAHQPESLAGPGRGEEEITAVGRNAG